MKAKAIFITDITAFITLTLSAFTGIMLHVAGHQDIHEIWHNWAVLHIAATVFLTISTVVHIYGHWGWYKSLFRKGLGNKSRVTVILSVVMLAAVLSGDILLFMHQGPNTGLGLWHYVIGIILTVIALGHFLKRLHILVKGLRKSGRCASHQNSGLH